MSAYPPYGDSSTQRCQRCAKPLAPTEVYCNTCGAYNILPAADRQRQEIDIHPGQLPSTPSKNGLRGQTSFGLRQYANQQWDQTSKPPSSHNSFTPQQQGYPPDSNQAPQQQTPAPSSTLSNFFAPNRNSYQAPQPQGYPPDSNQAPQQQTPAPSSTLSNFFALNQNSYQAPQPQGYPPDSNQAPQQQTPALSPAPSNFFAPNQNSYQAPQQQGYLPDSYQAPQQQTPPLNPTSSNLFAPNQNSYQAPQPPPYSAPPLGPTSGFQQSTINGYKPVGLSQWYHRLQPRTIKISLILFIVILLIFGGFGYYITKGTSKVTTSTATSLPTPSGTPIFSDSFQNNTNGWDLTSMTGKFAVNIGSGAMVLEENDHHLLWELLPGGRTYNNFQFTIDATLSKGDQNNGYGIYIRNSSQQTIDLATYYCFELYGDGTYAIFKGTVDASGAPQRSKLVDFTPNPAIQKVGNLNHLFIIAKGASITFIVNGQTLTTINDNSYIGGSVALFVSNLPNSPPIAQATFSKLAIYPV